jgi:hypothetical protein
MVITFSGTAFAAATTVLGPAFTDIAGHNAEFELTALKAYGIFTGDAGTTSVRPNDTITRAEVAKVLVTMLGRQNIAQGMAGVRPSFTDEVPTWAWGYVNCAHVMRLVEGNPDGTFKAGKAVTYAEVITMLVRAVAGHKEQVAPGFWPYNFLFHAIDYGFTGTVDTGFAGLPCPRGDMARLAFATMRVDKLSLASGTFGLPIAGSAILKGSGPGQLGYIYEGILTEYGLGANQMILSSGEKALAAGVYLVGASTFEGLMNLSVIAVADRDGKVLAVGKTEAVSAFAGAFKRIDDSVASAYKLEFEDGTKIPLPHDTSGSPIYVPARINGKLLNIGDLDPGTECIVTKDAVGKVAFVTGLHIDLVDYVGEFHKSTTNPAADTKVDLGKLSGTSYDIPASARVTINGIVSSRDDLRKWDVIYVARSYSHTTSDVAFEVRAVRKVIEGKPTSVRTTYPGPKWYATIGGVEYLTGYTDGATTYGVSSPLSTMVTYKLGLDKDNMTFVQIDFETATPFALIKGYTVYGDGSTSVQVDIRGVVSTYVVPNATKPYTPPGGVEGTYSLRTMIQNQVGKFAWLKVNERNEVIDFVAVTGFGTPHEIVANSAGGITLNTSSSPPPDPQTYQFIPHSAGAVCYKADGTYVDAAALGVGPKHKLAKAELSNVVVDFDNVADVIAATLYQYTIAP